MNNLNIKCVMFLFFVYAFKKCEGWSPVCLFDEDKDRVWLRILASSYKSKYLYPIGDYDGNDLIKYGIKKVWIPCGDSKKEYMVVGWFKNIYKNDSDKEIGRDNNILLWIAVFRKGHMLAKLGGQAIELAFFDCKWRRNFMNSIDRRIDLYEYVFPELAIDSQCISPYLIQFTFYELNKDVSDDDIVKRTICTKEDRFFRVDNPIPRINEITRKELGRVSLAYCKSNYIGMAQRMKNSDEIRKYVKFCKNNPLTETNIVKVNSNGGKNGDTVNEQGDIKNSNDPSKKFNLQQCTNPTDEEKEVIRTEMEKTESSSDDFKEELNYYKQVNGQSNTSPENQNALKLEE